MKCAYKGIVKGFLDWNSARHFTVCVCPLPVYSPKISLDMMTVKMGAELFTVSAKETATFFRLTRPSTTLVNLQNGTGQWHSDQKTMTHYIHSEPEPLLQSLFQFSRLSNCLPVMIGADIEVQHLTSLKYTHLVPI
jgi:hypothetical protein